MSNIRQEITPSSIWRTNPTFTKYGLFGSSGLVGGLVGGGMGGWELANACQLEDWQAALTTVCLALAGAAAGVLTGILLAKVVQSFENRFCPDTAENRIWDGAGTEEDYAARASNSAP